MSSSQSSSGSSPAGGWTPPGVEELQKLLPEYEIESILGRGGMGAVYKGEQLSLGRMVAIKVLPENLIGGDEDDRHQYVERFKLEARSMANLDHPAILKVHDFGQTEGGHLYIVMEFIDGMDIEQYIAACGGAVEAEYAVSVVSHVLDALGYAHSKGIVHRDIKPANVLLDRDGRVKIADFGLAKEFSGGADDSPALMTALTMADVAMGTPDYIAPEAFEDGVVPDHRADLYAVGVMLYKLLTGRLPRGVFRLPSEANSKLDPRFDDLVARAMAADPAVRFQTAGEFRSKLDELLSHPASKVEAGQDSAEVPAAVGGSRLIFPASDTWDDSGTGEQWQEQPKPPKSGAKKLLGVGAMFLAIVAVVVGHQLVGPKAENDSLTDAEISRDGRQTEASSIVVQEGNGSLDRDAIKPAVASDVITAPTPALSTADWPEGENFRSLGRFRAWSSVADDPAINLDRLRAVDDVRQVYMHVSGWLVLRSNGQTISSDGKADRSGIRRICPGYYGHFGLITEQGKFVAFDTAGEYTKSRYPPGFDSRTSLAADGYASHLHSAVLFDDGSVTIWGRYHDGVDEKNNPEWKTQPLVPEGRTVVSMANTHVSMVLQLDDGQRLMWSLNGRLDVPEEFATGKVADIRLNHSYIFGVPHEGESALKWNYRSKGKKPVLAPVGTVPGQWSDACLGTMVIGTDGVTRVDADFLKEVPVIEPVLEKIHSDSPQLLSLDLSRAKDGPSGRVLWFDDRAPAIGDPGAEGVPTINIDGESYFTWKGDHVELQALENPCSAETMRDLVSALDACYRYWMTTFGRDPAREFGGRLVLRDFRGNGTSFSDAEAMRAVTGVRPFISLADDFRSFERNGSVRFGLPMFTWLFLETEFGQRVIGPEPLGRELQATGDVLTVFGAAKAGLKINGSRPTLADWQKSDAEVLSRWRENGALTALELAAEKSAIIDGLKVDHTALVRGILFELCGRHGEAFLRRWLGHEVLRRPIASNNQMAEDNFLLSASLAAGEDLAARFGSEWRWPVSDAVKEEIDRELTLRPWLQTRRKAKPIEPTEAEGGLRAWTGKHFRIEATGDNWTPQAMGELMSVKDAVLEYWQWLFDDADAGGAGTGNAQILREVPGRYRLMNNGLATRPSELLHATLQTFHDEVNLDRWLGGCGCIPLRSRYDSKLGYPEEQGVHQWPMAAGLTEALIDIALERAHASLRPGENFGSRWLSADRALRDYENEFDGDWLDFAKSFDVDIKGHLATGEGMVLELYRRFGDEFLRRLLAEELPGLPDGTSNQQGVDGFFLACCRAARSDLSDEFVDRWRWPVSARALAEVSRSFPVQRVDGITQSAGWQDLMPRFSEGEKAYRLGDWQPAKGARGLFNSAPPASGIAVTAVDTEPLAGYDLRCRVVLHKGYGFGFLLPTASGGVALSCTVGAQLFGPEHFRSLNLWKVPVAKTVDLQRLKLGQPQEWMIEMRPDRLRVSLDGELFHDWQDIDWRDFHWLGPAGLRSRNLLGFINFEKQADAMEILSLEIKVHDEAGGDGLTSAPAGGINPPDVPGIGSRVKNFQRARLAALEPILAAYRERLTSSLRFAKSAGQNAESEGLRDALAQLDQWEVASRQQLAGKHVARLAASPATEIGAAAQTLHEKFVDDLQKSDAALMASFMRSLEVLTDQLKRSSNDGQATSLEGYVNALRSSESQRMAAGSPADDKSTQSEAKPVPAVSRIEGRLAGFSMQGIPLILAAADGIDDFVQVEICGDKWVALRSDGQTVCSAGNNRSGIVKLIPGPERSYGVIDRQGNLEVINGNVTMKPPPEVRDVVDAALGLGNSLAINKSGDLLWWGDFYHSKDWQQPPSAVRRGVTAIAARRGAAAAVDDRGRLYAWSFDESELDQDVRSVAYSSRTFGGGSFGVIRDRPTSALGAASDPEARVQSTDDVRWVEGAGHDVLLFGKNDGSLLLDFEHADKIPEIARHLEGLRNYNAEAICLLVGDRHTDDIAERDIRLVWIEPVPKQN